MAVENPQDDMVGRLSAVFRADPYFRIDDKGCDICAAVYILEGIRLAFHEPEWARAVMEEDCMEVGCLDAEDGRHDGCERSARRLTELVPMERR